MTDSAERLSEKFSEFFLLEVSQTAARSLKKGTEIEFCIHASTADPQAPPAEVFTFHRPDGTNTVSTGPARSPQIRFRLSPAAAEEILAPPHEDVGEIGVRIVKLIFSKDPQKTVQAEILAGFLTLLRFGYLGVMTSGGARFASALASHGFDGISGIKKALKKDH